MTVLCNLCDGKTFRIVHEGGTVLVLCLGCGAEMLCVRHNVAAALVELVK